MNPSRNGASNPPTGLNDRVQGWLRFLWRKATTPDDWTQLGEPHPWWDRYSSPPMSSFPRFDLSTSAYALGLMADQTPAWREVYATILEHFVERNLTFWAAVDWLTHIGHDPRRGDYPPDWVEELIPPHLVGQYDTPGWCANGVEPWGLQPDPVGADGNLFFNGWLNLNMSLHAYCSGEERWTKPFEVAGLERARFEWTQHGVVELLVDQWTRHPEGPHCENTKIWPFCLSAAGLGLQLYDAVFDKDAHRVFQAWSEDTRNDYYGFDSQGRLEWSTLYYDPLIQHKQVLRPSGGLGNCFYIIPQDPDFAELLYWTTVKRFGWNDPAQPVRGRPDPRSLTVAIALSREMGDETTFRRLSEHAEQNFKPRRFGPGNDEFGWWFNLGEDWPRGQLSALMAMGEVGRPGAWARLFREPDLAKFDLPTVTGVDYPTLGIAKAWNDAEAGVLNIATYAGVSAKAGAETRFQVVQLPDSATVTVRCDGKAFEGWQALDPSTIEIASRAGAHDFEIVAGKGPTRSRERSNAAASRSSTPKRSSSASPLAVKSMALSEGVAILAGPGCPCCVGIT